MIVTKDNTRLYLTNWGYNTARVISRLAKMVVENGGRVKHTNTAIISNRTLSGAIREKQALLDGCMAAQDRNYTDMRQKHIETIAEKLEELKAIKNDPITVTHTSYISFALNGMYYYYQVDDNPFFEFFASKTPIVNGRYNSHAGIRECGKEWVTDSMFSYNFSNNEVNEAAKKVFAWLLDMQPSAASSNDRYMSKVDF